MLYRKSLYSHLKVRTLISAPKQAASPSTGSSTPKKDPNAPPLTPLEKHLLDAGPIRDDGSDKFFGMENVSIQTAQTQRKEKHADEKLRGYVVRKYLVTSIMTLLLERSTTDTLCQ